MHACIHIPHSGTYNTHTTYITYTYHICMYFAHTSHTHTHTSRTHAHIAYSSHIHIHVRISECRPTISSACSASACVLVYDIDPYHNTTPRWLRLVGCLQPLALMHHAATPTAHIPELHNITENVDSCTWVWVGDTDRVFCCRWYILIFIISKRVAQGQS